MNGGRPTYAGQHTARVLDGQIDIVLPALDQRVLVAAKDPHTGLWHQVMQAPGGRVWTSPIGPGEPPPWYAIARPAARWRRALLFLARAPRRLTRAIIPRG